jgi:hypothetical protein
MPPKSEESYSVQLMGLCTEVWRHSVSSRVPAWLRLQSKGLADNCLKSSHLLFIHLFHLANLRMNTISSHSFRSACLAFNVYCA